LLVLRSANDNEARPSSGAATFKPPSRWGIEKSSGRKPVAAAEDGRAPHFEPLIRLSGFGFLSVFGFRASDFWLFCVWGLKGGIGSAIYAPKRFQQAIGEHARHYKIN